MIAIGVGGVGCAGWLYYDAWETRQSWDTSPEAAALAVRAAEPTPIWIAPKPTAAVDASIPLTLAPLPTPLSTGVDQPTPALPVLSIPTPVLTANADQLSLAWTDFRFFDPPEPGAHARLALAVANHADVASGRILLGIDSSWFEAYSIIGTAPAVSADRTDATGLRTFSFPPVPANSTANLELHVKSTAEGTRAPGVQVLTESGDAIGEVAKPPTFAPTPRPGPVMSIDIPRLKLHTGVVQTAWEPPPFAVGQIKGSANVTTGNTVLIGHLTGAGGNVFAHLDQLQPGDEITTMSRGLPYKFVVSQTFQGPNSDSTPMQPEDDARLTLMTCAGVWNPFTHDYSERLWVVAEPPDQAAVTIANAAATATEVAATATAQATLDAQATATAIAALPTATPAATPFAGDPSPDGGIGNSRVSLEKAFGMATGETGGKLVVFRPKGREVRVRFTPDPPRAQLVVETFTPPLTFDAAVRESRKLVPSDTAPRMAAPEGNSQFNLERFTSSLLAQVLGLPSGDFSVLYTRDARGAITSIIVGRGDDVDALLTDARQ